MYRHLLFLGRPAMEVSKWPMSVGTLNRNGKDRAVPVHVRRVGDAKLDILHLIYFKEVVAKGCAVQ